MQKYISVVLASFWHFQNAPKLCHEIGTILVLFEHYFHRKIILAFLPSLDSLVISDCWRLGAPISSFAYSNFFPRLLSNFMIFINPSWAVHEPMMRVQ
jgi:hypothetical protein